MIFWVKYLATASGGRANLLCIPGLSYHLQFHTRNNAGWIPSFVISFHDLPIFLCYIIVTIITSRKRLLTAEIILFDDCVDLTRFLLHFRFFFAFTIFFFSLLQSKLEENNFLCIDFFYISFSDFFSALLFFIAIALQSKLEENNFLLIFDPFQIFLEKKNNFLSFRFLSIFSFFHPIPIKIRTSEIYGVKRIEWQRDESNLMSCTRCLEDEGQLRIIVSENINPGKNLLPDQIR